MGLTDRRDAAAGTSVLITRVHHHDHREPPQSGAALSIHPEKIGFDHAPVNYVDRLK